MKSLVRPLVAVVIFPAAHAMAGDQLPTIGVYNSPDGRHALRRSAGTADCDGGSGSCAYLL